MHYKTRKARLLRVGFFVVSGIARDKSSQRLLKEKRGGKVRDRSSQRLFGGKAGRKK